MRALAIAATGMNAQQTNLEVIANNIANINTTGVQAGAGGIHRPALPGRAPAGRSDPRRRRIVPEGAQIGLGVRTAAIRNLHVQGALTQTGNKLDLALDGPGWFQVDGADGETLYTRAGAFNTNADRRTGDASTATRSHPAITVPTDALEVSRQRDRAGLRAHRRPDRPAVARPADARHFRQRCRPRAARRQSLSRDRRLPVRPITGVPGDPGFGTIHQGYLESSNVDPVKDITELIAAQRAYEMNSKVIQAADEMAGTVRRASASHARRSLPLHASWQPLAVIGLNVTVAAGAQLVSLPVPTATIYPGEEIEAGSLTDRTFLAVADRQRLSPLAGFAGRQNREAHAFAGSSDSRQCRRRGRSRQARDGCNSCFSSRAF